LGPSEIVPKRLLKKFYQPTVLLNRKQTVTMIINVIEQINVILLSIFILNNKILIIKQSFIAQHYKNYYDSSVQTKFLLRS